jgi:hypothetical protein
MVEEMTLEMVLDPFAAISGRTVTDEGTDGFSCVEGSPDFIIGFDGRPLGIEIAEIRGTEDADTYFEEVVRIASKKHGSYEPRGLFKNPIALLLHSNEPPLFDIWKALKGFVEEQVFDDLGFVEVWTADLSDAYFTPGHPLRPSDMFCMKPGKWFGFHRIGAANRKPFG